MALWSRTARHRRGKGAKAGDGGVATTAVEGSRPGQASQGGWEEVGNSVAIARANGHDDGVDCQPPPDGNAHASEPFALLGWGGE